MKYEEYQRAIECYNYRISQNRYCKDNRMNWYVGMLYTEIFNHEDTTVNNLDTNAIEKSIKYYYLALLYNILDISYHNLDYTEDDEKKLITAVLNNPETLVIEQEIKDDIINIRLPIIEKYMLEHTISDDSMELLEILRKIMD